VAVVANPRRAWSVVAVDATRTPARRASSATAQGQAPRDATFAPLDAAAQLLLYVRPSQPQTGS